MRYLLWFCLLAGLAYSEPKVCSEVKIEITAEDVAAIHDVTPQWVELFKEEAQKYTHTADNSTQPSLEVMRKTHLGDCVAFAKLGAWYALKEGYSCKFIRFVVNQEEGHMFLYATKGYESWAVSNQTAGESYSLEGTILRMGYFGTLFFVESGVTFKNLDNSNWNRTSIRHWQR